MKEYKKKYFKEHKTEHKLYMRKWRKRKHLLEKDEAKGIKRVKPFHDDITGRLDDIKIRKIE